MLISAIIGLVVMFLQATQLVRVLPDGHDDTGDMQAEVLSIPDSRYESKYVRIV